MTLAGLLYVANSAGFFISLIGFVFGSVMESQKVRSLLLDFWVSLTAQLESPMVLKARSLEIAGNVFDALYHRNGKLSYLKLFTITVLFNVVFLLGVILEVDDDFRRQGFHGITSSGAMNFSLVVFVWAIGSYFYEYLAYKISRYFLRKATAKNKRSYLGANLVALLLIMYVLPFLFIIVAAVVKGTSDQPLKPIWYIFGTMMMISPAGAMIMAIFSFDGLSILMLPAALSFCFPVVLLLGSLTLLHNRDTLALLVKGVESISTIQARRIKRSSLGFFSFIGTLSGALGYIWGS